ncbi:polymorphic toxin-type HINT domain-containing protein [Moraxella catarrhalis]|uniref:polymorphic toxin-type HINT domain-containing protein n=1 Tax=Moraxella catarrhalis TaxID=480 RepID=UPI0029E800E4|nr:polymorphic toxin-type HINT domain-containing protein [Moraxella catarrhalis]
MNIISIAQRWSDHRPVIATKVTPNQEIYEVVVKHSNNSTETFKTTKEHPFWVEGIGWLKASLLEQGMTLLDKHGLPNVTILSQTKLTHTDTVYNFEVQDFHTYHIGEYGVWVHNAECCGNHISSIVKQDELLLREARKLSQQESQGINQMMEQIKKGNENPGIGTSVYHGITEFRHRNGGRIYARKTANGWEVLGYSGKGNQAKVWTRLKELYGR